MTFIRLIWKYIKLPFVFLWALAGEYPIQATLIVAFLMITGPTFIMLGQIDKNEKLTEQVAMLSARNAHAIHQINQEKVERRQGQDNINTYVCQTNDAQDILLAKLVAVAVQILQQSDVQQDRDIGGKTVFERALVKLRNSPDCAVIVNKLKNDSEVGSRSKESKKGQKQ